MSPRATAKAGRAAKPSPQDGPRILVIHGPNLNLLGTREPHVYGSVTLREIDEELELRGEAAGARVLCHQSNHEGAIIDLIQQAHGTADAIVLNAGAYTHTSLAIRDAIAGSGVPTIEIHISNVAAREEFRHHSHLTAVCAGLIVGFGVYGYQLALEAALHIASRSRSTRTTKGPQTR